MFRKPGVREETDRKAGVAQRMKKLQGTKCRLGHTVQIDEPEPAMKRLVGHWKEQLFKDIRERPEQRRVENRRAQRGMGLEKK